LRVWADAAEELGDARLGDTQDAPHLDAVKLVDV
jgi:hypothetical protein